MKKEFLRFIFFKSGEAFKLDFFNTLHIIYEYLIINLHLCALIIAFTALTTSFYKGLILLIKKVK